MRLVLDTNVWLDWLVFDDAGVADLKLAVRAGTARLAMNDACRAELARVMTYDGFGLAGPAIATCLAEADRLAEAVDGMAGISTALPRCADPDDQKFLRLALSARADCLLTRDKALLRLARRTEAHCGFSIRRPDQWQTLEAVPSRSG